MEALKNQLARLISGAQPINKKIVFVLVGVVAVATFFLNSALSANKTSAVNQPSPNESTKSTSASDLINLPQLYVHLVGEVVNPGIYLLPTGSRVIDAVVLAGGFTKKADQGSVNLARSLTDGEQVIVFKAGTSELSSSAGAAAQTLGGGSSSRAGVAGSLISLNRASQADSQLL